MNMHTVIIIQLSFFACNYLIFGLSKELSTLFIYPPDYIRTDPPRVNQSGEMICTVWINIEIWTINEISLQTQDLEVDLTVNVKWKDHRLTVDPNKSTHTFWPILDKNEAKQIWMPAILFRNCKGCSPVPLQKSEQMYTSRRSGLTVAQIRLLHKFTCAIDLRAYPMDIQFCQIQLYTYEGTTAAIRLQHYYTDKELKVGSNLTLAEYYTAPIIKGSCLVEDAEGDVFSCIEVRIRLEHLITYHLTTSYAPTTFIVILSWISFWLPLELSPARVALGLTSLLTLATRLDQAQRNLPPVAYAKAIDVWMFACIFLVSGSLCEFAVSYYLYELRKKRANVGSKEIKVRPIVIKTYKFTTSPDLAVPPTSNNSMNSIGTSFDQASRIIFPLAFLVFNIAYWSYYLTYYN